MSNLTVVLLLTTGSLVFAQGNQANKADREAAQEKRVVVGNAMTVGAGAKFRLPSVSHDKDRVVGNAKTVGGDHSQTEPAGKVKLTEAVGNSKTVGGE